MALIGILTLLVSAAPGRTAPEAQKAPAVSRIIDNAEICVRGKVTEVGVEKIPGTDQEIRYAQVEVERIVFGELKPGSIRVYSGSNAEHKANFVSGAQMIALINKVPQMQAYRLAYKNWGVYEIEGKDVHLPATYL